MNTIALNKGGESLPAGCLFALGCFDGLHPGHRALLCGAKKWADEKGVPLAVWSPQGAKKTPLLLPFADKLEQLSFLGADFYVEEPFEEIRDLSPEDFFSHYLLEQYKASALACGENFTFGKEASGNAALLKSLCRKAGIDLYVQKTFEYQGKAVSSAAVRQALAEGNLADATGILGRPYSIHGKTQPGRQVGRRLGFPTLNLPLPGGCPLGNGVYAVRVQFRGRSLPGVANVGIHPTFENAASPLCEAHLLDFSFQGELYGEEILVEFLKMLRKEWAFDSPEALRAQVEEDKKRAREFFGSKREVL